MGNLIFRFFRCFGDYYLTMTLITLQRKGDPKPYVSRFSNQIITEVSPRRLGDSLDKKIRGCVKLKYLKISWRGLRLKDREKKPNKQF